MGLKVAEKLGTLGALDVVKLRKFAVPEKGLRTATVDAFDVHAEGHDDLEVGVGAGVVFDADLDGLVRNLNHFKVVLHFLFKEGVVQNHNALFVDRTEDVLTAAPADVRDWVGA